MNKIKKDYENETEEERAQRFAKIWWKSRAEAAKTQEYMALELGVARKTIQNWEKGVSAPSFFQGTEWFRALGLNPMPYYLSFLFPEGVDEIKPKDSDAEIEKALLLVIRQLDSIDKRRLLYLLYGNHGSSPKAVLNLINAHLQTPMKDRIVQAITIANNYEIENELGEIVKSDHIQPDMELLHKSIDNARDAIVNKQDGYSVADI